MKKKSSVLDSAIDGSSGWRIHLVSVLFLLFLIRLALPQYVKYLLFPLLAIAGIIAFIEFVKCFRSGWTRWNFSTFLPLVLVSLFYIVAFLLTSGKQNMLFKDFFNAFSVFVFIFILLFLIRSEKEFTIAISQFTNSAIIASTIFAFLGLLKLYCHLEGIEFSFLKVEGLGYPGGSSLAIDNNFFSLICLFGIILILPLLFKNQFFLKRILLQLSLFILLFNIFLSTSRRGFIIALAVMSGFITFWGLSVILKNEKLKQFRKNSLGFGIVSLLSISSVVYLLVFVSPLERQKRISFSKYDQVEVHTFINYMTLSIKSIFRGETEYQDINREIWQTNFDSRYPYTGWASGNYSPVSVLTGENVNMVPEGAIGAMVDKTTGSSSRNGNNSYYSRLFEKNEKSGKRYLASVYCYVSPEFDGGWVRINSSGKVKGLITSYYNLQKKGKWQKLETSFYADSGTFAASLYLSKFNSGTLDSLNGFIVFAYPELKEIDFNPRSPITWAGAPFEEISKLPGRNAGIVPDGSSAFKFDSNSFLTRDSLKYASSYLFQLKNIPGNKKRNIVSIYALVSDDFNGDDVYLGASGKYNGLGISNYDLANKGKWQKLFISVSPSPFPLKNNVNIYLNINKIITDESDSLRGDVLFAYPNIDSMEFDPLNPITWATRKYKKLKKLPGDNSGIVPVNSIGYLLDNESNFSLSRASEKYTSSTNLGRFPVERGKRYISSIYCFVSKDFNGEKVRLGTQGKIYGSKSDSYDIGRRGVWQRLYLNNYGDSSYVSPSIYFEIPKGKDVKYLKGNVVLAYPELNVVDYSPGNPVSYSKTTFKREFPLTGDDSDLLPPGIAGYRLDKTAEGRILKNNFLTSTPYTSLPVTMGDSVYASVYCYVSRDFNGDDVHLQINGIIKGLTSSKYKLKDSGKWVILKVQGVATKDGRVTGELVFFKTGVTDFSTLKGYVTFAYPIIQIVKQKEKLISYEVCLTQNRSECLQSASLFPFMQLFTQGKIPQEDSIFTDVGFRIDSLNNEFSGPRLERWRYAFYIFKNEYTISQKLIGGGFGYTRKFAGMFFREERDFDYPHNPFISVLLYSGLVGLIAFLLFIYKAVYYYWIYRKKYWAFGLCFSVAFFFAFFSANSPFDPGIVGVFSIVPYLIHYYHQKENKSTVDLKV